MSKIEILDAYGKIIGRADSVAVTTEFKPGIYEIPDEDSLDTGYTIMRTNKTAVLNGSTIASDDADNITFLKIKDFSSEKDYIATRVGEIISKSPLSFKIISNDI